MKRILLSLILISVVIVAAAQKNYTLLVIDIQGFYFPGGRSELVEPEKAAAMALIAIQKARETENPVICIQHKSAAGMEINDIVNQEAGRWLM